MISIDNLVKIPEIVTSGKVKRITFSWEADIDGEDDNPVDIELTIENSTPVFFLDVDDNLVKSVTWSTSEFENNTQTFTETLFIKVTQSQSMEKESVITMKARDRKGKKSFTICSITYK